MVVCVEWKGESLPLITFDGHLSALPEIPSPSSLETLKLLFNARHLQIDECEAPLTWSLTKVTIRLHYFERSNKAEHYLLQITKPI